MKKAPFPPNESERLKALSRYEVLDTIEEKVFDDITKIASQICESPIALVSLVDVNRQWFKSHHGLDARETPRDIAFCAHAILGQEIFEVPDSSRDERFRDNPLATGGPRVTFYAGAPLQTPDGYNIGTLCVIDQQPKKLKAEQRSALEALARQVIELFEAKRAYKDLQIHKNALERAARIQALGQMASGIAHEINNPLSIISAQTSILIDRIKRKPETLLAGCEKELERIDRTVGRISKIVGGLRTFARNGEQDPMERAQLSQLVDDVVAVAGDRIKKLEVDVRLNFKGSSEIDSECFCRPVQVGQIIMNLLSNALDAIADQSDKWIEIFSRTTEHDSGAIELVVRDSGCGISDEVVEHIFEPFYTTKMVGQGTGLGLSISHGIAKVHGGDLYYELDRGHTAFVLRLKRPESAHKVSA